MVRRRVPAMAGAALLAVAALALPAAGEADGPADRSTAPVATSGAATSGAATSAVTAEPDGPLSPSGSFTWAAHVDFLDRAPTPTELDALTTALDTGTLTRRQVVDDLARSPEWIGTVVDRLYRDTLDRPADPGGRTHWTDRIRAGTPVADVAAAFYASGEYFTGLGGGTVPTWIDDLYRKILLRPADPGGRTYWTSETTRTGRTAVARRFHQSPESARTRVTALYQALLGRAPDPSGLAHWAARIPATGDLTLARDLAASTEYATRAHHRYGPDTITIVGPADLDRDWGSLSSISGDGRHVTWSRSGPNGRGQIVLFDRVTGATRTVVADDDRNLFSPAISSDGRRIAYSSHEAEDGIWPSDSRVEVWDRTTGARTVVADGAAPYADVAIDATGDHVAYRAAVDTGPLQAWVWERGSGSTQVTDGNGTTKALALSGDGRRLVVGTEATDLVPDDPGAGIFLWRPGSGPGFERIADFETFYLSISGDGSTVVFHRTRDDDVGSLVYAWTPDGGTEFVTAAGWSTTSQSVSHDGRFVTVSESEGDFVLSVVVIDRLLDRTHRAPPGTHAMLPSISADGSTVTYLADDADDPFGLGVRLLWTRPSLGR